MLWADFHADFTANRFESFGHTVRVQDLRTARVETVMVRSFAIGFGVTPTWAKLIGFETTLPSAVGELIRQRAERERA